MADEELDAGLVERLRDSLPGTCRKERCRLPLNSGVRCPCANPVLRILGSLPIPAAALNALARGEAVVVPNIMTAEMKAVAGDLRQFVHYLPPEAEKRPADLEIYEPKGEAFERAFKAACAASPYAAKEPANG